MGKGKVKQQNNEKKRQTKAQTKWMENIGSAGINILGLENFFSTQFTDFFPSLTIISIFICAYNYSNSSTYIQWR